jgi:hypothetical protein
MKITINTTEAKPTVCEKCKRRGHAIFRHHMGNDAALGRFNKRINKEYPLYLDCVWLCNRCHMYIHFIYEPICQTWSNYGSKGVWRLRLKLIDICKLWLAGSIPNPTTIPRVWRESWNRSFAEWQRSGRPTQRPALQPARPRRMNAK